jgi:hypothetical protein
MRVAFHVNEILERGTGVCVYDYAHYNETILGNRSLLVTRAPEDCQPDALQRCRERFEVVHYAEADRLEKDVLEPRGVDVLLAIKSGEDDGVVTQGIRCAVQAVFQRNEPHGDVYAYNSEWLARTMQGAVGRWVPHVVHPPADGADLRSELGIPRDAVVFGRHGGFTTFDLAWVPPVVTRVARRRRDIHFVFLNTRFPRPRFRALPGNVHFLPTTVDPAARSRFINTCDAMIHARQGGESFGLACAEFSAHDKPVITWAGGVDRAHHEILGRSALRYQDGPELYDLLTGFEPDPSRRWDVVTERYSPQRVMRRFREVFLDGA